MIGLAWVCDATAWRSAPNTRPTVSTMLKVMRLMPIFGAELSHSARWPGFEIPLSSIAGPSAFVACPVCLDISDRSLPTKENIMSNQITPKPKAAANTKRWSVITLGAVAAILLTAPLAGYSASASLSTPFCVKATGWDGEFTGKAGGRLCETSPSAPAPAPTDETESLITYGVVVWNIPDGPVTTRMVGADGRQIDQPASNGGGVPRVGWAWTESGPFDEADPNPAVRFEIEVAGVTHTYDFARGDGTKQSAIGDDFRAITYQYPRLIFVDGKLVRG